MNRDFALSVILAGCHKPLLCVYRYRPS